MKVNLFANFRQLVGAKSVEIHQPDGGSLSQLLDALFNLYPRLETALMDPAHNLLPHVHVFVNGRDLQYLPEGTTTILAPDDKIDIFPPVAGG
jgi:molybdopterin synthase sulfur carrier subunit